MRPEDIEDEITSMNEDADENALNNNQENFDGETDSNALIIKHRLSPTTESFTTCPECIRAGFWIMPLM